MFSFKLQAIDPSNNFNRRNVNPTMILLPSIQSLSEETLRLSDVVYSSCQSEHDTRRILIVDDEPFNIQGLKIILRAAYKKMHQPIDELEGLIDTAMNGQEAVDAVKRLYLEEGSCYKLIITDLSMPIKDGY
jgi:PleD family two-component response regulator